MRALALVLTLALAGCASEPIAEQIKDEPLNEYPLRGEVISVDTQANTVKIQHEDIGDWMGAMTMDFPVKDAAEFAKLKPGEYIQGKVFVRGLDYWVGAIQPGTPPAPPDTSAEAK